MNPEAPIENAALALAEVFFGNSVAPLFAILDGASVPDLVQKLYLHKPQACCLYRGELAPDMASVAPYLVRLQAEHPFTQLVLSEGWGAHWGVFLFSQSDIRALRDHFRQFHTVELPDHRSVLFRYYDPRVLRIFLPACNPLELRSFFGPVQSFITEDDPPLRGIRFAFTGKALDADPFDLKLPELAINM